MTTIADEIRAWGDKNIRNTGVMTRNTDCYNHMQEALLELLQAPWATLVLQADMDHDKLPNASPASPKPLFGAMPGST